MPEISSTYLLVGIMVLTTILLILMIVLLAKGAKEQRQMESRMDSWEQRYDQAIRQAAYDLSQQTTTHRTETANLLRSMNDSLLNTLNGITGTQALQMETLQRQTQNAGMSQEQRLDRLQKATEESLSKYDQRMTSITRLLDEKLLQNENRLEKMRETIQESMGKLQTENAQKLEEMRKTVDEKLHETLDKRLGESFSQVSKRLEEVYKGLGEMQTLANGVGDLKKVLTNVKTRGIWGEMQLGSLLSQVLVASQYEENVVVKPGASERVEFALRLPGKQDGQGKPVYLPIDSKFPQEAFVRLLEAEEQADATKIAEGRRELAQALKTEAKRIAEKYIAPPHTTDFAIMFLPLEGLYAEAMRAMNLVEEIQRNQRVVIAGPSTLTALLNSLQMGFRTLAIEQRSAEVWKLLGAVKTDFGKFAQVLENTQKRLKQASESVDSAYVRTRSIERQLRKVEALDEGEAKALLPEETPEGDAPEEQA